MRIKRIVIRMLKPFLPKIATRTLLEIREFCAAPIFPKKRPAIENACPAVHTGVVIAAVNKALVLAGNTLDTRHAYDSAVADSAFEAAFIPMRIFSFIGQPRVKCADSSRGIRLPGTLD